MQKRAGGGRSKSYPPPTPYFHQIRVYIFNDDITVILQLGNFLHVGRFSYCRLESSKFTGIANNTTLGRALFSSQSRKASYLAFLFMNRRYFCKCSDFDIFTFLKIVPFPAPRRNLKFRKKTFSYTEAKVFSFFHIQFSYRLKAVFKQHIAICFIS